MESGLSLSFLDLGHPVETSTVLTSPNAMDLDDFVPPSNPPPLELVEMSSESQEENGVSFLRPHSLIAIAGVLTICSSLPNRSRLPALENIY